MPLVINNLGGGHTQTYIHVQKFADKSNSKKPGTRRLLVYKVVLLLKCQHMLIAVQLILNRMITIAYSITTFSNCMLK